MEENLSSNQEGHIKVKIKSSSEQKHTQKMIPEPVLYNNITYIDNGQEIAYADCMEISLLRFLHLLFGDKGAIDFVKLQKYMDLNSPYCQDLVKYFKQNCTYSFEAKFYETKEGMKIRAEWGRFLNESKLFQYHKGKYQLNASLTNLFRFYKAYFPRLTFSCESDYAMTLENINDGSIFKSQQLLLNQIYHQLSFDCNISMKMSVKKDTSTASMNFISFSTIQQIFIDEQLLIEWQINQFCFVEDNRIGLHVSGHSDYRFPKKV